MTPIGRTLTGWPRPPDARARGGGVKLPPLTRAPSSKAPGLSPALWTLTPMRDPISLPAGGADAVREAVSLACRYWPNSHLGDYTVREDMRSAFRLIRSHVRHGDDLFAACGRIAGDAHRYANM